MIKAIIFDLSGVLIEDPALKMLDYFRTFFGIKIETFRKVDPEIFPRFQRGMISEQQLWKRICSAFEVAVPDVPSLWEDAFRSVYKPKEEMFSLAAKLKEEGYKVGLLSNSEVPAMSFFLKRNPGLFDATVFSCIEGTMKPERRIYEIALESLEVQPHEAVFIDDREDFLEGARKVGINTILCTSPPQVHRDLTQFSVRIH
jgi:putative hydrolase of the HAD superfamily